MLDDETSRNHAEYTRRWSELIGRRGVRWFTYGRGEQGKIDKCR